MVQITTLARNILLNVSDYTLLLGDYMNRKVYLMDLHSSSNHILPKWEPEVL